MTAASETVLNKLTQLSNLLNQFNQQLRKDDVAVTKNKIANLNQNNEDKQVLLQLLSESAEQIQSLIKQATPDGKTQSLTAYINQLDHDKAEKATGLMSSIHNSLAEGYELLIKNNNVIIANLSFMKDFLNKLIGASQTANPVYEKPGQQQSK